MRRTRDHFYGREYSMFVEAVAMVTDQRRDAITLQVFFEKLYHYFSERADVSDLDTLRFCLQQLFYSTDQLYLQLLPELTTSFEQQRFQEPTAHSADMHYTIWTLLQEVEKIFTRLEPLCHLLISATNNVLESMDRSCSIQNGTKFQDLDDTIEVAFSLKQTRSYLVPPTRWRHTYAQVLDTLHMWQQQNKQRLLFSQAFPQFMVNNPTLLQADAAFDTLLESVWAIFGDILPDFQTIPHGDDESVAPLLLDLIQKADQQLLQISMLIEPFHVFTKEYAVQMALHRS